MGRRLHGPALWKGNVTKGGLFRLSPLSPEVLADFRQISARGGIPDCPIAAGSPPRPLRDLAQVVRACLQRHAQLCGALWA